MGSFHLGKTKRTPFRGAFVSYSSLDHERVCLVIDALVARGAWLWIDRDRIDGSDALIDEISRAIRQCKGVVVFISRNSVRSSFVRKELEFAFGRRKRFLPVVLDDAAVPAELDFMFGQRRRIAQGSHGDDSAINELWRVLQSWNAVRPGGPEPALQSPTPSRRVPGRRGSALGELMPYLVNRFQQERALRETLLRHAREVPRRPLVLIAHGAENQAIHEYLQRMQTFSLPSALAAAGYDDHVKWIELPLESDWYESDEQTVRYLLQDLTARLAIEIQAWPAGLSDAVSGLRSAVVISCRLHCLHWRRAHLTTLRAWIRTWDAVPDLPPRFPVVVLIAIKRGTPSFFGRFAALRAQPLAQTLSALADETTSTVVAVLPELGNVTFDQIEQWVFQEVRPRNPSRMIAEIEQVIANAGLRSAAGVPMRPLINPLLEILEATARGENAS